MPAVDRSRLLDVVYDAIDEVNSLREASQQIEKSENVRLYGQAGALDSLALVNLVVALEQGIDDAFGVGVSLVTEETMSPTESPFRTVKQLVDYLEPLISGAS